MSKLSDKTIQAALKRVQTTRRMERIAAGDWLALLVTASGVGRWQQRCRYGGKATSPIARAATRTRRSRQDQRDLQQGAISEAAPRDDADVARSARLKLLRRSVESATPSRLGPV